MIQLAEPAKIFVVKEYSSWKCFLYVKLVCLVVFISAALITVG